jgi:signal transduction histidine kinase
MFRSLRQRYRRNMAAKIVLPAVGALMILAAVSSTVTVLLLRDASIAGLQDSARHVAAQIAEDRGVILDILEGDYENLERVLATLMQTSPDAMGGAAFVREDSGVIKQLSPSTRLSQLLGGIPEHLADLPDHIDMGEVQVDGKSYLRVTAPVMIPPEDVSPLDQLHGKDNRIGAVQLLWSLSGVDQHTRIYLWAIGVSSLLVALVGALFAVRLSRKVLSPIVALYGGMERVMQGELDHRIYTAYDDEIGQISEQFNAMAERLRLGQEQIQSSARELEGKVAARTQELQSAYEQMRTLDKAKDRFLSGVSHEMRTPLTSIVAACEILGEYGDEDHDTRQEFLDIIRQETARLRELVDDVIDMAKIEARTLVLELNDHDLAALLTEVAGGLRRRAQDANVTLNLTLPEGCQPIRCDGRRLRRMLGALVRNAIDHSPSNAVVDVSLAVEPGTYVVSVRDRGPGIATEALNLVFSGNLQQTTMARQRAHSGLGLSLPLSADFARRHGGVLQHDTPADGGALFVVRLPR